ncbi:N-acetylmuramate alpha-1-phosphate uridylyltransferase MurU [Sulfurimonas sp. HSL3-7]|uniref:N-acetylmuramate alpha-1-phosphate uridylyltransferase MurU n=1 Tax=Sulfonitrofixus jiaomeiensis TaxID=3131938 RepID=UPI0031F8082E
MMKKAMILAAGLGNRMRPLTNHRPKPLLEVAGKPLIVYHIEKLVAAGFEEVIINIAHLGFMIPETLGNGSRWGVKITYSDEQEEGALESAGGIVKALPLLGDEPFLVVNGDVWCDYPFDSSFDLKDDLAHLILVQNPDHNQKGDFALKEGRVSNSGVSLHTFSGIGYYSPRLFDDLPYGKCPLAPLLRKAIADEKVSGELYGGEWRDVGTPERLAEINATFR